MDSSFIAQQQLETGTAGISFDALNLWASKRESEISQNRIETKVLSRVMRKINSVTYEVGSAKAEQA